MELSLKCSSLPGKAGAVTAGTPSATRSPLGRGRLSGSRGPSDSREHRPVQRSDPETAFVTQASALCPSWPLSVTVTVWGTEKSVRLPHRASFLPARGSRSLRRGPAGSMAQPPFCQPGRRAPFPDAHGQGSQPRVCPQSTQDHGARESPPGQGQRHGPAHHSGPLKEGAAALGLGNSDCFLSLAYWTVAHLILSTETEN